MDYRELFRNVHRRPGLHGLDGSYPVAVAFISGCDAAMSYHLLAGFREWLVVQLGYGNNLHWAGLVKHISALTGSASDSAVQGEDELDRRCIDTLFELLDKFLQLRNEHNGLTCIFDSYLTWLKSQDWFRPEILQNDTSFG